VKPATKAQLWIKLEDRLNNCDESKAINAPITFKEFIVCYVFFVP
jgi:hypothetical protein